MLLLIINNLQVLIFIKLLVLAFKSFRSASMKVEVVDDKNYSRCGSIYHIRVNGLIFIMFFLINFRFKTICNF